MPGIASEMITVHLDPEPLSYEDECSETGCPYPAQWLVSDQWGRVPICKHHLMQLEAGRSLEDRSSPLLFTREKKLDGLSVGRLPKPTVFGLRSPPDRLMRFGRLYAKQPSSLSGAAASAGIAAETAKRFVEESGLRGYLVQRAVSKHFSEWEASRQKWRTSENTKWGWLIRALENIDVVTFEPVDGVADRAYCRRVYSILSITRATRMFKWSCRTDGTLVTVRRTGEWFRILSLPEERLQKRYLERLESRRRAAMEKKEEQRERAATQAAKRAERERAARQAAKRAAIEEKLAPRLVAHRAVSGSIALTAAHFQMPVEKTERIISQFWKRWMREHGRLRAAA